MRGGGGNYGKRCRCKVAFDMINHLAYKPFLNKCHLIHFNDNNFKVHAKKGLYNAQREAKKRGWAIPTSNHDYGDVTMYNPIAHLYMNSHDGTKAKKKFSLLQT